MKTEKIPGEQVISRTSFPASRKVHVKGQLHDISVAMREISLSETKLHDHFGETEPNAPVTIYDTRGSYTDPDIEIDVKQGLSRLCEKWITDRNDVEQLEHISSDYGNQRANDHTLDT
jgi:phosphomethylpyrimidine synthase